jgi:hypothetical protein
LNDLSICHQNRDTKTPLFATGSVVKAIHVFGLEVLWMKKKIKQIPLAINRCLAKKICSTFYAHSFQ